MSQELQHGNRIWILQLYVRCSRAAWEKLIVLLFLPDLHISQGAPPEYVIHLDMYSTYIILFQSL